VSDSSPATRSATGLEQRVADELPHGVRGLGHALAEDAAGGEHLAARHPGVDERPVRAHERDVLVGEQALVVPCLGLPVEPGFLQAADELAALVHGPERGVGRSLVSGLTAVR